MGIGKLSDMTYLYGLFCLVLLCSCAGSNTKKKDKHREAVVQVQKNETKYVNSVKMLSPEKNQSVLSGENVLVTFECKERFALDSSVIFLDGKEVAKLASGICSCSVEIPADKMGRRVLKLVTWHPDKKQGIASIAIEVKPDKAPVKYSYEVLKTYPHDTKAYTQGLIYQDGYMYEGTGQYGESSIRKIEMNTGKVLSVLNVDSQLFGEGITIFNDKIYQLTWRSRKGFVYDLKSFSLESSFTYNTEGWGITTVGDHLVMSDGSNKLYHIDPLTFNVIKEVEVYDSNGKVSQLNELEYVGGVIWANVWLTDRIVAIDPDRGVVVGELDMKDLLSAGDKTVLDEEDDVLNGIAWNPEKNTFYVTGKRWPKLFEIKIDGL